MSLASSALDFFVSSLSAGGAVYAPSSIRNVRVNASKDSHPAEAPFAFEVGEECYKLIDEWNGKIEEKETKARDLGVGGKMHYVCE